MAVWCQGTPCRTQPLREFTQNGVHRKGNSSYSLLVVSQQLRTPSRASPNVYAAAKRHLEAVLRIQAIRILRSTTDSTSSTCRTKPCQTRAEKEKSATGGASGLFASRGGLRAGQGSTVNAAYSYVCRAADGAAESSLAVAEECGDMSTRPVLVLPPFFLLRRRRRHRELSGTAHPLLPCI